MFLKVKSYVIKRSHITHYTIQLPPEWIKMTEPKRGDLLAFYMDNQGRLLLKLEKDEKTVEIIQ